MRIKGTRALGAVLAMVASGAAWAPVWDWDNEFASRHWRSTALTWAQNTHPDHPSVSWIQTNFGPPPNEMWCHSSPAPTAADCSEFHDLLDEWLQDFLDTSSVPQGAFNTFPKECTTICTP